MWFTYIIRGDNNSLYTGITTDIQRRWHEHASGGIKGARFFRLCKPLMLCRLESYPDRSSASKRESAIKKMNRTKKEQLVAEASPLPLPDLPQLRDL